MLSNEQRVLEKFPHVKRHHLYNGNPFYSCVICAQEECRKEKEKETKGDFGTGCGNQILQVPVTAQAILSID